MMGNHKNNSCWSFYGTWPTGLGSPSRLGQFKPYARIIGIGSHVQTQQGSFGLMRYTQWIQ